MKLNRARGRTGLAVIAAFCILIDQLTKWWAMEWLSDMPGGRIDLIENVLSFHFVRNTGAAFSFLSGHTLLITVISFVIIMALFVFAFFSKTLDFKVRICSGLLFAGGAGNLIDRLRYGAVVDFISLDLIRFPVFNVADICVSVGAVLMLLFINFPGRRVNGKR